jgi:hypothetical protein
MVQMFFSRKMRGGANHRLPSADYNVMHQLFVYIFLLVRTSEIAALANSSSHSIAVVTELVLIRLMDSVYGQRYQYNLGTSASPRSYLHSISMDLVLLCLR